MMIVFLVIRVVACVKNKQDSNRMILVCFKMIKTSSFCKNVNLHSN